ncbi:hypothetical protein Agabi119p4_2511 [Agaricus bisporus var. burnettii]|uniref:RNase H type-1 domain-containing protein n=1 Tax=Agaricus bisporus var. burnettii TaxID=192524 RepID=A0A8H7KKF4_AGABI|nr:hypothetical protein Agabi119p4_2511 [Agaricus bisporus var. burnettii]
MQPEDAGKDGRAELANETEDVPEEWDPRAHNEVEGNEQEGNDRTGKNVFRWKDNDEPQCIMDAIRITPFSETKHPPTTKIQNIDMEIDPSPNEGTKTIYLAGACTKPNTNDARAGSGISSTDLHLQLSLRTPGIQTLFAAELYGVKSSLECANNFQKIKLVSTSKRLIKALTSDFKTWEDQGWIEAPNSDLIKQVVNRLRIRKAPTLLELLEDTSNGMNEAKSLAKRACNLQQEAETNPPPREEYHPSGAKLQSITQAIAYKLLLNNKAAPESKTSKISVQKIQEDIEEKRGYKPTSQKIWHQLKRSKNCLRKHKEFIYKAIKGTYYIDLVFCGKPPLLSRQLNHKPTPCKETSNSYT